MSCRSTMENFAKPNEIKYNIKNIVEPWVGKEIAKKFDEMQRITIKTNEDFNKE